jgi:uncharacterized protein YqfA (UPF0365 family)
MYDPEHADQAVAELQRRRAEVDELQTECAEWEAIVGMHLAQALAEAHARHAANDPYALADMVEQQRVTIVKLRDAFDRVAKSRNEWRDRAKRAGVRSLRGEE